MPTQIGFMGPALFLSQLGHVKTATGAVACMMASQGLDSFSQSGLYSNHQVRPPALALALPAASTACAVTSCWPGLGHHLQRQKVQDSRRSI